MFRCKYLHKAALALLAAALFLFAACGNSNQEPSDTSNTSQMAGPSIRTSVDSESTGDSEYSGYNDEYSGYYDDYSGYYDDYAGYYDDYAGYYDDYAGYYDDYAGYYDNFKDGEDYVDAIYDEFYGDTKARISGRISFSELCTKFTNHDCYFEIDLRGKNITLTKLIENNADVYFKNGSITTTKDAYFINNGSITFDDKDDDVKLFINGNGIINNGTIILGRAGITLYSGIAIQNQGTIGLNPNDSSDGNNASFKHTDVEIVSGTFIKNTGTAYIYDILILAENNDNSDGVIIYNAEGGTLYIGGKSEIHVNKATAIYNLGNICHFDWIGQFAIFCNGGVGINNFNTIDAKCELHITDGVGIINNSSGVIGSEKVLVDGNYQPGIEFFCTAFAKNGTIVINDGSIDFRYAYFFTDNAMALNNRGKVTGALEVDAVGDVYSNTLIYNDVDAIIRGSYFISSHALKDAVIFDNKGYFGSPDTYDFLSIRAGITITENAYGLFEFEDENLANYKLSQSSTSWNYVFDQTCVMENSVIVRENPTAHIFSEMNLYLAGAGIGKAVGVSFEPGSDLLIWDNISVDLYGSNLIGIDLPSGVRLTGADDFYNELLVNIGLEEKDNYVLYQSYPDNSKCFGNTGIVNSAILNNIAVFGNIYGFDNTLFINDATAQGREYSFHLMGHNNIGVINNGTIETENFAADSKGTGGNIAGINNDTVRVSNYFTASVGERKNWDDVYPDTEAGIGLINKKMLYVPVLNADSYDSLGVGLHNYGNIYSSGGLDADADGGIGLLNEQDGYMEINGGTYIHSSGGIGMVTYGSVNVSSTDVQIHNTDYNSYALEIGSLGVFDVTGYLRAYCGKDSAVIKVDGRLYVSEQINVQSKRTYEGSITGKGNVSCDRIHYSEY